MQNNEAERDDPKIVKSECVRKTYLLIILLSNKHIGIWNAQLLQINRVTICVLIFQETEKATAPPSSDKDTTDKVCGDNSMVKLVASIINNYEYYILL